MADELKITITATDGASKVFEAVVDSAEKIGPAVEGAAQEASGALDDLDRAGQDAQVSLDEVGESAQASSRSLKDFSAAGKEVGAGLALVGAAFIGYAQSVKDNDIAIANLNRTYGDAADSFVELADLLQDTTVFSNDEAIQAAATMGTLARNYDLTADQIRQLIIVSADLAAVNGTSLGDAATRVAAAMRGEAESAEMLGLTMNDAAIGIDTLSTSTTDAERAQIRFNALLEQSAFATGAAGDQADTTAGQVQQLANKFKDAMQDVVRFTGPVGEAAAGMSSFGLEAGLAIAGFTTLGKGIRDLVTAAGGMGGVITSISRLGGALGAVGLGAAAIGAVYAARELSRAFDSDFYRTMENAEAVASDLDAAIVALVGTLGDAQVALSFQNVDTGLDQVGEDLKGVRDLVFELQAAENDAGGAFGIADEEAQANAAALRAEYDALVATYGDLDQAATDYSNAQGDLATVLTYTGAGADLARSRVLELAEQFNAGEISLADYAWQLNWVTENLTNYDQQALEAAVATEELTSQAAQFATFSEAAFDAAKSVGVLATELQQLSAAGLSTPAIDIAFNLDGSALQSTFDVLIGGSQALAATASDIAEWSQALVDGGENVQSLKNLFDEGAISLETYNGAIAANTEIQAANAQIQQDILSIQAQQAPLIAELTAQQAEYIAGLADLTAEQQMVALGFMDSAQSARAMELAYLAASAASGELGDTGTETASQIISAAAQADPVLKAMLTDMGLISEGATGEVVVNFPNASSVTESVDALRLSIDALTVALGGIPPANTSTNASETQAEIDGLTNAIGGVPPSTTTTTSSNAADTQVGVDNLTGAIIGIPDSHNTSITATDNASGTISSVISQLNSIPAATYATVYVNTVSSGLPAGTAIGGRLGGVMGYSNGGMVMAQLAEAGPELLSFRDGGQAIVPHPGVYMVERGTSVTTAPATAAVLENAARSRGGRGVNFYGPVTLQPVGQDAYGAISSAAVRRGR